MCEGGGWHGECVSLPASKSHPHADACAFPCGACSHACIPPSQPRSREPWAAAQATPPVIPAAQRGTSGIQAGPAKGQSRLRLRLCAAPGGAGVEGERVCARRVLRRYLRAKRGGDGRGLPPWRVPCTAPRRACKAGGGARPRPPLPPQPHALLCMDTRARARARDIPLTGASATPPATPVAACFVLRERCPKPARTRRRVVK